MKKILSIVLILCLVLTLAACGAAGADQKDTAGTQAGTQSGTESTQAGGFRVGFGREDITPKGSVPMASYGNARERMSEGIFTYLYINVLAIDDGQNKMLLMTIDHSWFSNVLADPIKERISSTHGIPNENILIQGTHTHAAPEVGITDIPAMAQSNERTITQTLKAVDTALKDLKPAEIYVGSVMTENMNHVRRYFMDDGSFTGDNYAGTGTVRVAHETEADREIQLLKFVRDGGESILIVNFQAHPHLEGKTLNLSAQTPGATRDAVEEKLGGKCIYWQGAAGNLNTHSSLDGETPTKDRVEYGKMMANYIATVYDDMTKVESGPIQIKTTTVIARINHTEDHLVDVAQKVSNIWADTNDQKTAMEVGTPYGIRSVYHAAAILNKSKMASTGEIVITAFSFGDVSGVVVPYEMFDTSGMQIKDGTPFEKTFIFGYANTGYGGYSYMPDVEAYKNVGYEGNQCRYEPGTAEQLVEEYLGLLKEMKGE